MAHRAIVIACCVWGMWHARAAAETGRAALQGTSPHSTVEGVAMLTETPNGLEITVNVVGVPPGAHGVHIHQFGDCADKGQAAGGHYNPEGTPHGFLPKDGVGKAHPGDMGNLEVRASGSGSLTVVLPGVTLGSGAYSVGGRAIVLHEKTDDFGQPTGNAGGRIGCGIIMITGQ
jgi:Cu-Zn family superoxide dismutase